MSTLSVWRPRPLFDTEFDREFDRVLRRTFAPAVRTRPVADFAPSAEVVRDGEDAVVRLEIPGVDVGDVTVEVVEDQLVVRGERRDERSSDEHGRTLREIRYGSFRRTFALPRGVAADAVSASYDAGVLSVRVAGAHAGTTPATRTIAIRTASSAVDSEPVADHHAEQPQG